MTLFVSSGRCLTMVRIALLISLNCYLFAGALATAGELYRWVEPDGAITFSPTRPPAGIAFDTVGEPANSNQAVPELGAAVEAPETVPALDRESKDSPGRTATDSLRWQQPESGRSADTTNDEGAFGNRLLRSNQPQTGGDVSLIRATDKARQCQDLAKRVVSLERRLKSDLSAEAMDTTVISMARYQRSIDQFCSR